MDLVHRDQKASRLANHPHNMLEKVIEHDVEEHEHQIFLCVSMKREKKGQFGPQFNIIFHCQFLTTVIIQYIIFSDRNGDTFLPCNDH